jgi:hypothetical protein
LDELGQVDFRERKASNLGDELEALLATEADDYGTGRVLT